MGTATHPHLRPVPGYDGYAADAEGNIWSCRGNKGTAGWRRMRPPLSSSGHPRLNLRVDGRRVPRSVSHLVLLAFVGPRPEGTEACHFPDPNPLNNRPENLRWDTKSENQLDALRLGRKPVGSKVYGAKLAEQDVPEILRLRAQGETFRAIAARFGVTPMAIYHVAAGRAWKHVTPQHDRRADG